LEKLKIKKRNIEKQKFEKFERNIETLKKLKIENFEFSYF